MSVFESLVPSQPTPEQAAMRVKRSLAQAFRQMEVTLGQVHRIVERHGAEKIKSALGNDRAEVANLCAAFSALLEQHKPGASTPALPK
jgi:hypothetical protein